MVLDGDMEVYLGRGKSLFEFQVSDLFSRLYSSTLPTDHETTDKHK